MCTPACLLAASISVETVTPPLWGWPSKNHFHSRFGRRGSQFIRWPNLSLVPRRTSRIFTFPFGCRPKIFQTKHLYTDTPGRKRPRTGYELPYSSGYHPPPHPFWDLAALGQRLLVAADRKPVLLGISSLQNRLQLYIINFKCFTDCKYQLFILTYLI